MVTSTLFRSIRQFDSHQWRPWTALRCSAALAIVLVVAYVSGHRSSGALGCLGALYTGMVSFTGLYQTRLRRMATVSVLISLATLIGCLASGRPMVSIAMIGILSFCLSLFSSRSPVANTIAIQCTAVLVVLCGIPAGAQNPIGNALVVLGGAVTQIIVLLIVRPFLPHHQERIAVSYAIDSLVDFVRDLRAEGSVAPIPNAQPFQDAWSLIDEIHRFQVTPEQLFLQAELRVAEILRAGLVGFARADQDLRATGQEGIRQADQLGNQIEQAMRELAAGIRAGSVAEISLPNVILDPSGPVSPQVREFAYWTELLIQAIDRGSSLSPEIYGPDDLSTRVAEKPKATATGFGGLSTFALRELSFHHALRYATILTGSEALSQIWGAHHSYWLPLTVGLILRPDYSTTLTRGVSRLVGTLLGVVIATVLALVLPPIPLLLSLLLVVTAWFAWALYLANYALYATAITLYVVLSVAASGVIERSASLERLEATAAGVLIAVTFSMLWPIWESRKVAAVLRDALEAQIAYGTEVAMLAKAGGPDNTEKTRRKARTLRVEAERVITAGGIEPPWSRRHAPFPAQEMLVMLDENAARMLTVQVQAPHEQSIVARRKTQVSQSRLLEQIDESLQIARNLETKLQSR